MVNYIVALTALISTATGIAGLYFGDYSVAFVSISGLTTAILYFLREDNRSKLRTACVEYSNSNDALEELATDIWYAEELANKYASYIAEWMQDKNLKMIIRHVDNFYIHPSEVVEGAEQYIRFTYYPYEHELLGVTVYISTVTGAYVIVEDDKEDEFEEYLKSLQPQEYTPEPTEEDPEPEPKMTPLKSWDINSLNEGGLYLVQTVDVQKD